MGYTVPDFRLPSVEAHQEAQAPDLVAQNRGCQVFPDMRQGPLRCAPGRDVCSFRHDQWGANAMYGSGQRRDRADNPKVAGLLRPSPSPKNASDDLARFIREQNLAHFKKCLTETTDETRRQILRELIAGQLARM
jgi:hypothetical protein